MALSILCESLFFQKFDRNSKFVVVLPPGEWRTIYVGPNHTTRFLHELVVSIFGNRNLLRITIRRWEWRRKCLHCFIHLCKSLFFFKNLNHFELTLDAFCSIYSLVSPFHFASFHTKSISGNKVKNIVISKVDTLSVSRTPHVGNDRPLTKVSTSFLKNPR